MIDLTVIIPHFEIPSSLEILLNSIPSLPNIQVIVVDDKSIKNIAQYDKIKLIFNNIEFIDNNSDFKGAGVCRNIGLKRARGRWVIFADSDDYFTEDFYLSISKYFNSDYDVVFFSTTSIDEETKKISFRHKDYSNIIDLYKEKRSKENEILLRYGISPPFSKLINKNFLEANKIFFDETLVANDVMFSCKVGFHMERYTVSKEVIYCLTLRKGSLTTTISKENFNIRLNVFINQYIFLKNNLTKTDFNSLGLSGMFYLLLAKEYKLSLKEIVATIYKLKKKGVKIINMKKIIKKDILKKCIKYIAISNLQKNKFVYKEGNMYENVK